MIPQKISLPTGAELTLFPAAEPASGAVILCPGGAYLMRSPAEGELAAPAFAAAGFHAFVLKYRIGKDAFWPNPLEDLALAVRLLRTNAAQWNIPADRIAVCGFSAGGHLCASLATQWNNPTLSRLIQASPEQLRPDAVILGYPALNLYIDGDSAMLSAMAGNRPPEQIREATDTVQQVGAHVPPVFLWSIYDDTAVPAEQSLLFCRALAAAQVPFELHTFFHGSHACGLAHGPSGFLQEDIPRVAEWFPLCMSWLESVFSGTTARHDRAKQLLSPR